MTNKNRSVIIYCRCSSEKQRGKETFSLVQAPEQRFVETALAGMARFEGATRSRRIKAGLLARKAKQNKGK